MTRTLASIQKIVNIKPIEGADRIELCTILGWQVVVAKSEKHFAGEKVIYVEIDSILPARPEFEFLKDRNYRVKTIKLRGQISQGLILPMSILGNHARMWKAGLIGTDVTEALGIIKYDSEEADEQNVATNNVSHMTKFLRRFAWYRKFFMSKNSGGFPSWIKKTDETRIQNFPNICQDEYGNMFEATEKLDGTSATYFLKREKFGRFAFGVCSRNIYLKNPDNSNYWKIAKKYDMQKVLRKLIGNKEYVVLQGEIIGEGIQKNKYGLRSIDFFAFNLIFPDGQTSYIGMCNRVMNLGIKCVPVIHHFWELPNTIEEAVKLSVGKSILNTLVEREGLVCRDVSRNVSFKIINPQFLLKNDE